MAPLWLEWPQFLDQEWREEYDRTGKDEVFMRWLFAAGAVSHYTTDHSYGREILEAKEREDR